MLAKPTHTVRRLLLAFTIVGVAHADSQIISEEKCKAAGGDWNTFNTIKVCDMPTKDAGRPCSDTKDCQSVCITSDKTPSDTKVTGKCFARTSTIGTCTNIVVEGRAIGLTCED